MTDIHIAYTVDSRGRNNTRYTNISLSPDDRRRHLYVIGQTGTGKSTFLHNNVVQDMLRGHGVAFIDVHGQEAEELLEHIPRHRTTDVIYFNPADSNPVGFNPLFNVPPQARHLVIDDIISSFRTLWPDVWGIGRMEYITSNVLASLIEYRYASLLDVKRILVEKHYRERVIRSVTDSAVLSFWRDEFDKWSDRHRIEAISPIQNKVGQLLLDQQLRNVFGQKKRLNFRGLMDDKKIFIANLSKGKLGEKRSKMFASLLLSHFYAAALTREDQEEEDRTDYYLYVDEFQNAATQTVPNILSEARKYGLNLTVAHQYLSQMPDEIGDAVFGTVGNIVCFRTGSTDAKRIENEFFGEIGAYDLGTLDNFEMVYRQLKDGRVSVPKRANIFQRGSVVQRPARRERVIRRSRRWFGGGV